MEPQHPYLPAMTAEELLFQLGELAADLLAYPDSYDRQRRLAAALDLYDLWRWDRDVLRGALDALGSV